MPQDSLNTQSEADFHPGFRVSSFDAAFLLAGLSISLGMADSGSWLALIPGYVVSTFFLFCNVFRIARRSELLWTFCFLAAAICAVMEWIAWWLAFAGSATLSIVLFVVEFRRPSYHGVLWRRINPNLSEWWKENQR